MQVKREDIFLLYLLFVSENWVFFFLGPFVPLYSSFISFDFEEKIIINLKYVSLKQCTCLIGFWRQWYCKILLGVKACVMCSCANFFKIVIWELYNFKEKSMMTMMLWINTSLTWSQFPMLSLVLSQFHSW